MANEEMDICNKEHRAKMREAGVIETRRHGLIVFYRLVMP